MTAEDGTTELHYAVTVTRAVYAACSHVSDNAQAANCELPNTCTICSAIITPAASHSFADYTGSTATCTAAGTETATCNICPIAITRPAPALGHSFAPYSTPADCITDGESGEECPRCFAKNNVTVISKLGHDWAPWSDDGDGENFTRTCTRSGCAQTEHDYVPLAGCPGHDFSGAAAVIEAPTCISEGAAAVKCVNCAASINQSIPTIDHSFGSYSIIAPADYEEDGWERASCLTAGCTAANSRIVPATGHNWGAWVVTVPATATAPGSETRTCEICSATETQQIPATGNIGGGGDGSSSASLASNRADFAKGSTEGIAVALNLNNQTVLSLTSGSYTLKEGTDYAISGNTITIKSSYLETLPAGEQVISFNMSAGNSPRLTVTVEDEALIASAIGDVNGDGEIDIGDVNAVYLHVRGKRHLTGNGLLAADVNNDSVVDIGDVNRIYLFVRGKITEF